MQHQSFYEQRQGPAAPTPRWPSRFRNLWGPKLPPPIFCFRPSLVNVYPFTTPRDFYVSYSCAFKRTSTRAIVQSKSAAGKEGRGSRPWLDRLMHELALTKAARQSRLHEQIDSTSQWPYYPGLFKRMKRNEKWWHEIY